MRFKESLQQNNSIVLQASAQDWRSAIKIGTDKLIASGAIEPRYHDAIIGSIEKLGAYIVLAPGLAMPHARPEDGVRRTAFALVTLQEPVYFPHEEAPVDLFITLAGSSSDEHMQGLMEVTQILEDDESPDGINLEGLRRCRSADEVYHLIDEKLMQQN